MVTCGWEVAAVGVVAVEWCNGGMVGGRMVRRGCVSVLGVECWAVGMEWRMQTVGVPLCGNLHVLLMPGSAS